MSQVCYSASSSADSSPSSAGSSITISSSTTFSPFSPSISSVGYQCFFPSNAVISTSAKPASVLPVRTPARCFPPGTEAFLTSTPSSPKIASLVGVQLTFRPLAGLPSIDPAATSSNSSLSRIRRNPLNVGVHLGQNVLGLLED